MRYTHKTFWIGAAERAIKTGAQVLASLITVGQAITDIDWPGVLAITATAVIGSLITSVADPAHADITGISGTCTIPGKFIHLRRDPS